MGSDGQRWEHQSQRVLINEKRLVWEDALMHIMKLVFLPALFSLGMDNGFFCPESGDGLQVC